MEVVRGEHGSEGVGVGQPCVGGSPSQCEAHQSTCPHPGGVARRSKGGGANRGAYLVELCG